LRQIHADVSTCPIEGAAGDKIGVVVNGQAQQGIAMEPSQEPTSQSAETGLGPIGSFLLKTVIVCAAIIVSGWIMLDLLDDFATRRMEQLERSVRAATSLGGHRFWTKLENELDRLADPRTDLSPEKRQKILSQIKVISDRWRPFLTEAAAAIEGESKKAER
jgi:hypothetical protein